MEWTGEFALTSATISRISAIVLLLGGICLLFASDALVPMLAPGTPRSATWPGQLVAAGWLAVAALNWLSRGAMLGGIYGRPVVSANLVLYFVTAMVLLRTALDNDVHPLIWIATVLHVLLAGIYGWLLFRGPFEQTTDHVAK